MSPRPTPPRAADRVIVTGGAGFIGSRIAKRLSQGGTPVTVIDDLSTGRRENLPAGVDFIELDLGDRSSYDRLSTLKAGAVFHLAGQSSGEASFLDPYRDFKSHVLSTFWLLDWCKTREIGRFVYASSMSVYGNPRDLPVPETHPLTPRTFYGAGKAAAEAYVRLYQSLGLDTTIFRMFSVYGPGQNLDNKMQGMVSIYLSYLLEGVPVPVKGSRDRFRDLIFIDDVVDAWTAALKNPATSGKTFNLATGQKTTVGELVAILVRLMGHDEYPVHDLPGTPGDQFGMVADVGALRRDLGWAPRVALADGLRMMVEHEKQRARP